MRVANKKNWRKVAALVVGDKLVYTPDETYLVTDIDRVIEPGYALVSLHGWTKSPLRLRETSTVVVRR